ncbi:fungal trichothecene efflux pump [Rhizodiscina lignyota]|uniref:Fungal trichothecene efflux pump n=1 Tax=Rhizodiscina lignyota TaxID=1504668 RepID=A0A9P4M9G8_9PEZI|nr:fungal trichothecene efflux pump [Rhizodiscina lignyota]
MEGDKPGIVEAENHREEEHHGKVSKALHHDHVADEAIGGHARDLGASYWRSPKFLGTLIATCLAQISGYLGWVLPANTLTLINAAIGPSPNIIWLAVGWTAGFAVGFTLVGRLSDIFGRRWFFIGASVLAVIGNIIGAAAQSIDMLIATNTINGLAAAGQLSFSVVMGELVSNRNRGPINALVLFTSVPFAVFGPPVARALFEHTGLQWRWSYILGVIVNTIAVILYFFFYHPPTYEMLHVGGKSRLKQLKTLDWLGIFLFTAGLTIFLIGLNWGGSAYSWSSGHVLGTLLSGIAILAIFCVWEAYCTLDYPLMPMRLFRNIKYDATVACASIGAMVYYSMTVIWPTMAGALYSTDVQEVGWLSCAVGGGLLLGQVAAGLGVKYIPRMKIQMTVAAVILTAFCAALASSTQHTRSRTVGFLLIAAISAGYVENLTLSTMALVWDPADIGLVAGVLGAIRTAAGAIATSMYSSILSSRLAIYLPQYVTPAATSAGLPSSSLVALFTGISAGDISTVPGVNTTIAAAVGEATKTAYSHSFRIVFLCTLPFGAIILVSALLAPNVEDYLTDEVARKLQGVVGEKNPETGKVVELDEV